MENADLNAGRLLEPRLRGILRVEIAPPPCDHGRPHEHVFRSHCSQMPLRVDECAVDTRAVRIDRIEDTEKLFGEWLRASWPMLRCKFDGPLAVTDIVRKSTDLLLSLIHI